MSRIDAAAEALRDGRPVLVTDGADRENEGDVILAAEHATPEWVAWTVRYTSGLLCAPMPSERADMLHLPPMVADNVSNHLSPVRMRVVKNGPGRTYQLRGTSLNSNVTRHSRPLLHGAPTARAIMTAVHRDDTAEALAVIDATHHALHEQRQALAQTTQTLNTISSAVDERLQAKVPMSIGELAHLLSVRTSTLRVWENAGSSPHDVYPAGSTAPTTRTTCETPA